MTDPDPLDFDPPVFDYAPHRRPAPGAVALGWVLILTGLAATWALIIALVVWAIR